MTDIVAPAASAPATHAAAPAATSAATQAAAPATPATPAAPAAQPAAEAPAAPAAQEPQPQVWSKTGDEGLDMALSFIGQRGFGPDHPAVQAAIQGNFDLLRAQLAGMGDKATGYEAYIALAERAYKAEVDRQTKVEAESIKAVLSAVGSPENWQAIHAWAKANADEAERAEINAMLSGGPRQAKAAAIYLRDLYEQHSGESVQPARAVKPTASAGGYTPSSGGPIMTAGEYSKAVNELHRKLGSRMEGSAEYAELKARRLAGKRAR